MKVLESGVVVTLKTVPIGVWSETEPNDENIIIKKEKMQTMTVIKIAIFKLKRMNLRLLLVIQPLGLGPKIFRMLILEMR